MGTITDKISVKILFVLLFVVVLPLVLLIWGIASKVNVSLPAYESGVVGMVLILAGVLAMVTGSITLFIYGKGLPMSPFPPTRYVSQGIYRIISHPIYTGACLSCIGVSIYFGSSSGLWLVSPVFILGCVAYVQGFEKHKLRERFPDNRLRPLISIPQYSERRSTFWDRVSAYVYVLLPWFLFFQMLYHLGVTDEPFSINFTLEAAVPLVGMAGFIFILPLPLVLLSPLVAKTKADLWEFMISGMLATATGFYLMILFPLVTPPGSDAPILWQRVLHFVGISDSSFLSFPSFHIIWTFISIPVFIRRFPRTKFIWWLIALMISYSTISTGQYSILDVLGGLTVVSFVKFRKPIWQVIQHFSEKLANSWKEWNIGLLRLLNHGLYGALASFIAVSSVGAMIGEEHMIAVFTVFITAVVSAALWAQFIEGSEKLLRPLGFYGGVLGTVVGCFIADQIFQTNFVLIFAAFSVAAPWVQAVGRLRCLIQGCCHGNLCQQHQGIRYFHERSRVVRLAGWKGKYVYPTPVYSILANMIYGSFLVKLWLSGAPMTLMIGLSFIFNGLSRFVEESYRGEPQTPIFLGLRFYQWLALFSIIAGAFITAIPSSLIRPDLQFSVRIAGFALTSGLIAFLFSGVDFPRSNKRFSRLV